MKTHCVRGHEFTPENTFIDTRGKRCCVKCSKRWSHKRKPAKRKGGK